MDMMIIFKQDEERHLILQIDIPCVCVKEILTLVFNSIYFVTLITPINEVQESHERIIKLGKVCLSCFCHDI